MGAVVEWWTNEGCFDDGAEFRHADSVRRRMEKRESMLNRIAGFLLGYAFFISYTQSDGLEYAQHLASRLQDDGF